DHPPRPPAPPPRPLLPPPPRNVPPRPAPRRIPSEEGVLALQIRQPERLPLAEIDASTRRSRIEPVEQFGDFRRLLRMGRLPWLLRRLAWWAAFSISGQWRARFAGTFGVTGVAALGSASLHLLSPLTTT